MLPFASIDKKVHVAVYCIRGTPTRVWFAQPYKSYKPSPWSLIVETLIETLIDRNILTINGA